MASLAKLDSMRLVYPGYWKVWNLTIGRKMERSSVRYGMEEEGLTNWSSNEAKRFIQYLISSIKTKRFTLISHKKGVSLVLSILAKKLQDLGVASSPKVSRSALVSKRPL